MSDLIFNRLVTVTRAGINSAADATSAVNAPVLANRTTICASIPAQISAARIGPNPPARLPGDSQGDAFYDIVFRPGAFTAGTFFVGDFVTDDGGSSYLVVVPCWSPIGYTLTSQLMVG
jgi:hypothetical protein